MKTAVMSSSPPGSAVESAVDAYATRVLQASTPPETFLDTSLGPYVTSVLRCTEMQSFDVTSLIEFESLLELLEDQCNMERDVATKALKSIAEAVVTGFVPQEPSMTPARGLYNGNSLDSFRSMKSNVPLVQSQLSIDPYTPNSAGGPSPLKPDNLIPVDLLGFLDDPSPQYYQEQPMGSIPAVTPQSQEEEKATSEEAFPPLGAATNNTSGKNSSSKKVRGKTKGSSKSRNSDKELAAALFRPSRLRQNSIDKEEASPPLSSLPSSQGPLHGDNQYFQQQLDSCVEILLSMNSEIGEAAALEAATMAKADFNVAQYIIDKALSAPPVCRHMLHDGCYRSDCQFSHDVEGHTCLFWLRSRCTKPVSVCKFLHGFHPKLMDGIAKEPISQGYGHTHNLQPWQPPSLADSSASNSYSSSIGSNGGISFSFANIASRGHDKQNFMLQQPSLSSESTVPTVRIPQNLWNPNENRDASVFHIVDPMERYHQVSLMNHRDDVVDLHFQSIKTFGVVLEQVLLPKLEQTQDGIWIVTGTGHHVGNKTHQKSGGALERAVMTWLQQEGYSFWRGKDRNGLGGALLVKR